MRKPSKFSGTSFHGVTITTTVRKLIDVCERLGIPYEDNNTGDDKTNFDFDFETEDGTYFTVYDWKNYRPLGLDERITWNIGGANKEDCLKGKHELADELCNCGKS